MIQPKRGETTMKSVCISDCSAMEFDKYGYSAAIPRSEIDSCWYTLAAQGYFNRINVTPTTLILVGNLSDITSISVYDI